MYYTKSSLSFSDEELLGLAVERHTVPPGKADAVTVWRVDDVEAVAPLAVPHRVGGGGPVNGFTGKNCGLDFLKVHSLFSSGRRSKRPDLGQRIRKTSHRSGIPHTRRDPSQCMS